MKAAKNWCCRQRHPGSGGPVNTGFYYQNSHGAGQLPSGTFAFDNPGTTVTSLLSNVAIGDSLALPGSAVTSVTYGTNSLTIVTNQSTTTFSDVTYSGATPAGFTASADPEGLERITFTAAAATFNAHVYTDSNGDGSQDNGESGLPGVTVNLLDGAGNPTGQSATTDASGNVSFTGLTPGSYEIAVVTPSGDVVSQASNTSTPNTSRRRPDRQRDRGRLCPGDVFNVHVYDDLNTDGTQDTGDTNAAGVTVNLLDGAGNPTGKSTTTDSNGNASFTGLAPGAYEVNVITSGGAFVSQSVNLNTPNTLSSGGTASATEELLSHPRSDPADDQPDRRRGQLSRQSVVDIDRQRHPDPSPGSLTITAVGTAGTQGAVSLNAGADSLIYIATGFNPSSPVDAFTYTLKDAASRTVTGTVDVTVTGPNLPTTVATTPGSTTTATGSGQRLISEGCRPDPERQFGRSRRLIVWRRRHRHSRSAGAGNVIFADPGNHFIAMGTNNNTATLQDGNNTVTATGTGNTVTAGNGNNSVSGMTGSAKHHAWQRQRPRSLYPAPTTTSPLAPERTRLPPTSAATTPPSSPATAPIRSPSRARATSVTAGNGVNTITATGSTTPASSRATAATRSRRPPPAIISPPGQATTRSPSRPDQRPSKPDSASTRSNSPDRATTSSIRAAPIR